MIIFFFFLLEQIKYYLLGSAFGYLNICGPCFGFIRGQLKLEHARSELNRNGGPV